MKKSFTPLGLGILLAIGAALLPAASFAQAAKANPTQLVPKDSSVVVTTIKKEEKNRNEMLNADNNTGPRQVNIGLPFGTDVLILENGVPIVYNFFPTIPTTTWRYDNSISKIGLLSFAEGALTFGKVGFVVNSYDREATSTFKGFGSINTNTFGSLRYDLAVGGPLTKKGGWGYTLGMYQSFDRGNGTNYMFTPWQDRTQIYKGSISKKYKNGDIRLLYKHSDASNVNIGNAYYPFVYEGNGNFKPVEGFKPGSDSYLVNDGNVPFYNPNTGEAGTENIGSDGNSRSVMENIYLIGNHNFKNGWKLTYSSLFQAANSSFDSEFPVSIGVSDTDQQVGQQYKYQGSSKVYTGPVQLVAHINFPNSNNRYSATRVEMAKKIGNNDLRFGTTYQYSLTQYTQHSSTYFQTVEANPERLDLYAFVPAANAYFQATNKYGALPANSGGYGNIVDYSFSKLALYASDDIKLGKRVDIAIGGRIEHQNIHEVKNIYLNDFIKDRPMVTYDFKDQFNKVGLLSGVVKITKGFGILGDATYNSWYDRVWDFAYRDANGNPIADPATPGAKPLQNVPKSFETSVLNLGAGIYYNSEKFSLVSKVTKISKENIYTQATLTNPANLAERKVFDPIFYDISTLGWSTDIVAQPFKGASVHLLVTLQNPMYKNYSFGAFGVNYDYSDKIIPGLSKVLIELDPSYTFNKGKMRAWASLRYFGKQYGNPTNSIFYNGWIENFGGLDYLVSRKLDFKFQVTNFLDQRGVKGTLQGAEQILDDSRFINRKLVASAIRPRTIEFTVNYKF